MVVDDGFGQGGLLRGLGDQGVERGALVVPVVQALAVRGGRVVGLDEIALGMGVVGLQALHEGRADRPIGDRPAVLLLRGEDLGLRLDAQGVGDGVEHRLDPLLVSAVHAVRQAERPAPRGDGVRLLPQSARLGGVVGQHVRAAQGRRVPGDDGGREVGGGGDRAVEDLGDDVPAVDGQRDGLPSEPPLLAAEMREVLGDGERLERGQCKPYEHVKSNSIRFLFVIACDG